MSDASSLPIDALLGRSMGGLSGRMLRFRPQLFWQEVLPEQAASSQLEFHCHMETGRNFARLPTGKDVSSSGGFARSTAVAVADADVEPAEAQVVTRALREAATFDGALMHLLTSCYCTRASLQPALIEASRHNHVENVKLLLAAGASASAQPDGKSALHVACESGHEEVARALVAAEPTSISCSSAVLGGKSPLEVAREQDMGGLARRLEQYASKKDQAAIDSPPSSTN